MKKILFIGTGNDFPRGPFAFLQDMHRHEPITITGLFFQPIDFQAEIRVGFIPVLEPYNLLKEKEKAAVKTNQDIFASECRQHNITAHLHSHDGDWDKALIRRESRFSDLLILSADLFCSEVDGNQPNILFHEALHAAGCPVMIVPENYQSPRHLIMAYDGNIDSIFAIRQFTYLLPHLTRLPTEIIYIKDDQTENIPDAENLRSYAQLHFSNLNISKLHGKASGFFTDLIRKNEANLLVTGAFGRSSFSYMTKPSFADKAIHDHSLPVFIAHT